MIDSWPSALRIFSSEIGQGSLALCAHSTYILSRGNKLMGLNCDTFKIIVLFLFFEPYYGFVCFFVLPFQSLGWFKWFKFHPDKTKIIVVVNGIGRCDRPDGGCLCLSLHPFSLFTSRPRDMFNLEFLVEQVNKKGTFFFFFFSD